MNEFKPPIHVKRKRFVEDTFRKGIFYEEIETIVCRDKKEVGKILSGKIEDEALEIVDKYISRKVEQK